MSQKLSQEGQSSSDQDFNSTDKASQRQKTEECPLCAQPSLQILISNALYHKYLDSQYLNYLKYIDNIMDDELCPEAVQYKEMAIQDDQEEFMRRMYSLSEYQYKNKAIVEYYKFHHDYPKIHLKGVSRIMESYFDRKKEFQYKKIKRVLKQQEDISITTQKSSEIFSDIDDQDRKSNYSNVLNDMTLNSYNFNEESNESQVLKNICTKIGRAYQNQPLSPLNLKKKSIFDQTQNKEANQTKNFMNYLKKQQDKKQKEEKYKNFIRSNKESKYNSIQHETKQYASRVPSTSNLIRKLAKVQKQKPIDSFKGTNAFYDGRLFNSNSNNKGNFGSISKQRTKQQTNPPSQQQLDFDHYFPESGFKKNKESTNSNDAYRYKNENNNAEDLHQDFQTQKQSTKQLDFGNFKGKPNIKTTESIYKNATQDMKLKKRSFSYNSLAHPNQNTKRSSVVNPSSFRQKDFDIRNRIFSQSGKSLKDRHGVISNLIKPQGDFENQIKLQVSKSSGNFKTARSVPKFYQAETILRTQSKLNQNSGKKISLSKDVIKSLKGKSYSGSKLKTNEVSSERSGNQLQKQTIKQRSKEMNLFIQNGLKGKLPVKNLIYSNYSSKNMDIEKLLDKKLFGKGDAPKTRQHKILI